MSGILARIKALFEPGRSSAPREEVDVTPTTAATAPEIPETPLPEPITTFEPRPVAEAAAPSFVAEAAAAVEDSMPAVEDSMPVVEEAAPIVEQAASIAEQAVPIAEKAAPVVHEAATAAPAPASATPAGGLTLRLESERGSAPTFQVTKSGATIGRGPESTIQLADLSVSRKHAKITYRQGAYWLSDVGSMGGTWIDGTKLAAPRRVATGQTIDIGVCRLTVIAAAEGETTGAAKGPSNAA
jgi:FHA domain-containing protein